MIEPRLRERIRFKPDGCWEWTGHFQKSGTPLFQFYTEKKENLPVNPRAFFYNRLYGQLLGHTYRSTCRNDKCVNPTHHHRLTLEEYWRANTYEHPNGCIEWMGPRNNKGYGRASHVDLPGGETLAHRVAYWMEHGVFAQDHTCHTCDTTWCVNADHLFDGTPKENTADMVAKGRHVSGFKRREV